MNTAHCTRVAAAAVAIALREREADPQPRSLTPLERKLLVYFDLSEAAMGRSVDDTPIEVAS